MGYLYLYGKLERHLSVMVMMHERDFTRGRWCPRTISVLCKTHWEKIGDISRGLAPELPLRCQHQHGSDDVVEQIDTWIYFESS